MLLAPLPAFRSLMADHNLEEAVFQPVARTIPVDRPPFPRHPHREKMGVQMQARKIVSRLVLFCLLSFGQAALAQNIGTHKPHWWFTLDMDFAGGASLLPTDGLYEQRLRIGPSYVHDFHFWSLSATAETFNFNRFAFGIQADFVDISSGWNVYTGATISTTAKPGITLGVGWSIFHVEGQYWFDEPGNVAVFGLLRIPIGTILYAKYGPKMPLIIPPNSISLPSPPH